MNRAFPRLGFTALALVAGSALYAQSSSTTGSVSGMVADPNGAPLAGASVTLSSGQITRSITTAADGGFRLGLLNPGTWTIRVSKDGLQTQTSTVTVSPNDNRAVNFKLLPIASATVEVIGAAQVVDTTSTTVGQNISMNQISSIPNSSNSRDFSGIAYFVPGVADGGFQRNSPSMSGASAAENSYYVDGLDTTDYRYGFQGAQLKTDFIDQVSVQTAGFAPEYSALGGVFNAITKSGTNDIKGSAWVSWDAVGIHAALKKNASFNEPTSEVNTRYDIGAEVEGPIIKDKLFYFVGVDGQTSQGTSTPNVDPGLSGDKPKDTPIQTVFKINWFLSQDMQLTWYGNYNSQKITQGSQYPFPSGTARIGVDTKNTNISTNLSFDWSITSSLALSVKLGYFSLDQKNTPQDTADSQILDGNWYASGPGAAGGLEPAGIQYITGGAGSYTADQKDVSKQLNASLSWFVGTHNVKVGVSHLESAYTEHDATSGDGFTYSLSGRLDKVDFYGGATVKAYYDGVFAQDNWEIIPGFRVLYGFRYERQKQDDYKGVAFVTLDKLSQMTQPRLGFTWDLNNDGKTKIAGSWARYFERIPQRAAFRTWAPETYKDYVYDGTGGSTYSYNTTNGSFTYGGTPASVTDFSTPFSYDPVAQGLRPPQRDEVALGVDHTFESGWTAGVHAVYRKMKNIIEDSVIITYSGTRYGIYSGGVPVSGNGPGTPNVDGHAIWWNPGGSVTWTQTAVSPDAGTTYSIPNTGFEPATNQYQGVTLTLDKRTDRDYFSFNYTLSRLVGNYEGVVSSSNGQADGNITASFDSKFYVGYGLLPLDHTNVAKMQYSHRFTVVGGDFNLGFSWQYQSGTPLSLFDDGSTSQGLAPGTLGAGNAYDPLAYGNSTPANGQLGQYGRTPSYSTTDAHMDYAIGIGPKVKVSPSVDIFNLFNTRSANAIYQFATQQFSGVADPRYGSESNWVEGRRFRFGVKVQF